MAKSYSKFNDINKLSVVCGQALLILFLISFLYFHNNVYAQLETAENAESIQVIKDPEKEVPSLNVILGDQEVEMDPFMYSQINFTNKLKESKSNVSEDNIVTKINPANLYETQSDIDTKLTLKHGDKITLSYEKEPLTIKAYLIDYDTEDETEIYPIKQIDLSTFSIPTNSPSGLKSLEIRSFFDNNEQITYTTPVFIESNTPETTPQNVNDDNEE
ncbi:MAG TPA: hypothetical protein VEW92_14070 [Nitrososphaeraceae archaeon]|nr:hypothetical protein [Nitrososphaeraceae archaeon]